MAVDTQATARKYTHVDWIDFAHTGPGTLAGRYMRSFWQPVSRSRDLTAGRARPLRIMSEDFTLYRWRTRSRSSLIEGHSLFFGSGNWTAPYAPAEVRSGD